ncbi:hypothetical protein [Streptomyces fagopyri]|uniref:hypothetical protein n=1 Tax=Streptomyces fagopyri TaxID=2662397 RepID=UPI00372499FB
MSRVTCRSILGQPEVSFRTAAWDNQLADSYPTRGLTLEFGVDDTLEAIEAAPPARPVFEGIDLLTGAGRDVLRLLAERSSSIEWDLGVYNVEMIGVSIFSPSGPDSEEPFASVSVFKRGIPSPPVFFGEAKALSTEPLEISDDRIGGAFLGMSREEIRSNFGEGMATDYFGWGTDIFFSGIVAQYDAEDIARRLVATSPAQVEIVGRAVLGISMREFAEQITLMVPDCMVSDDVIIIGSGGPKASISRAGANDLPISAVSIGQLNG